MLTIMKMFMPKHKDSLYGIMVEWCIARSQYYSNKDIKKSVYWTKQASKYLLKRLNNLERHAKSFV